MTHYDVILINNDVISDKYLIAQTFVYFCRCSFSPDEFTISNFYLLLYLANDMEEDLDFKVITYISKGRVAAL